MNKKQVKKLFGISGTKRLRKQWTKAIARGKIVFGNDFVKTPNFNPMKAHFTKEQRILNQINSRLTRMGYAIN